MGTVLPIDDLTSYAREVRRAVTAARKLTPHIDTMFAERAIDERLSVEEVQSRLFRIIVISNGMVL